MRIPQLVLYSISVVVAVTMASSGHASQQYIVQPGVTGKVVSVGSDTMANMMELWAEQFELIYPEASIEVDATGSSTAPPALVEGVANIGAMSREMKPSEISGFVSAYGYPPTVLKVALDAIAIFVERQNTIAGLNVQQIDAIYSATRFCGGANTIDSWKQLSVNMGERDHSIQLFGRNSVSGTHDSFKSTALCQGDFKNSVSEQPGSASVVLSVASTKTGIGYAAMGYKTAGVRALPIAERGTHYVPLTLETVRAEQYPFTRFLYLVVNKKPNEALPKLELEFLRFVLSTQGQELVTRDGYFPISDTIIQQQIELLNQ